MKRQGLIVTLKQLRKLELELLEEFPLTEKVDDERKFQINIINKTPECSDTWEIEDVEDS